MFERRDELAGTPAHETALACLESGIEAARPQNVIREALAVADGTLQVRDEAYNLADYDELLVLGGGKAAAQVGAELETLLGDRINGGLVVTNDPLPLDRIEVVEGSHPVPDEAGREGASEVLERAEAADESTLVLAVLTGGGSALLPAPAGGLGLDDLQAVTDELLRSGADIGELNAVRKHCSAIKGGGLARAATPATVVGLLFSDVIGDDYSVIASGPTAPDESTYGDALSVLERYGIDARTIHEHVERGTDGKVPETPGPDDPLFECVSNHVLANAHTALDAASEVACERGYTPLVLSSRVRGEARESALTHLAVAEEIRETGQPVEAPAVVLSGGETTVTVEGDGRGGPNQEFVLAAGIELDHEEIVVAAVDTDGKDGAADAAGGLVDAGTVEDADAARTALADNDAFPFLADRDALLETGPTGTNVNDLRVLVVE